METIQSSQELARSTMLKWSNQDLQQARLKLKASYAARNDTPAGYKAFHEVCLGLPQTEHSAYWIVESYKAHEEELGLAIWAHRDAAKSTDLLLFIAFRIGHNPLLSHLLIQSGEEIADQNCAWIGNMIMDNLGWREVFPYVRPWVLYDKNKNWGRQGYEVIDTRYMREWATMRAKDKNPTLVGKTWDSRVMIGRRPTGGLWIDDINTEQNTSSATQNEKVTKILSETILLMATKDPSREKDGQTWKIAVGTPWNAQDALHFLSKLPTWRTITTPVYKALDADEGTKRMAAKEPGVFYFDPRKMFPESHWTPTWVKVNWPEKFTEKYLYQKYFEAHGKRGFARMYMLDISLQQEQIFKPTFKPHHLLQTSRWPVYIGVDPAFELEEASKTEDYHSMFAMCFSVMTDMEELVPFGGVVKRCTLAEGITLVKSAIESFPNCMGAWIEVDGVGRVLYSQILAMHPGMKIWKARTENKSKRQRLIEGSLGMWFEAGRVKISDRGLPESQTQTPDEYLDVLRKQLAEAPDWTRSDCVDAMYYSIWGARNKLRLPIAGTDLPKAQERAKTERPVRPFSRVGAIHVSKQ